MYDAAAYDREAPTWLTRAYATIALIADAAMSPAPQRVVIKHTAEKAKRRALKRHRRLMRRMARGDEFYG